VTIPVDAGVRSVYGDTISGSASAINRLLFGVEVGFMDRAIRLYVGPSCIRGGEAQEGNSTYVWYFLLSNV
jgi:hypothetical protein